jgi:hypothetical protein
MFAAARAVDCASLNTPPHLPRAPERCWRRRQFVRLRQQAPFFAIAFEMRYARVRSRQMSRARAARVPEEKRVAEICAYERAAEA